MIEVLYRGKRIDNGKWVYGYVVKCRNVFNKVYTAIIPICDKNTKECNLIDIVIVNENTVGQFIGLTDKNGKNIFDGDIVKCENFFGEVIYSGNEFSIKDIPQWVGKCSWYILNHCEVTGNIYDNQKPLN